MKPDVLSSRRTCSLVAGYRAPPDAENLEEIIVEALRLALLVRGVGPFADEFGGARTNLVPGQAHGLKVFHVCRSR